MNLFLLFSIIAYVLLYLWTLNILLGDHKKDHGKTASFEELIFYIVFALFWPIGLILEKSIRWGFVILLVLVLVIGFLCSCEKAIEHYDGPTINLIPIDSIFTVGEVFVIDASESYSNSPYELQGVRIRQLQSPDSLFTDSLYQSLVVSYSFLVPGPKTLEISVVEFDRGHSDRIVIDNIKVIE